MYYVKSKEYLVDEDNDTIDYDTIIEIDLEETEERQKIMIKLKKFMTFMSMLRKYIKKLFIILLSS